MYTIIGYKLFGGGTSMAIKFKLIGLLLAAMALTTTVLAVVVVKR
jgi:hypothetical protein